MAFNFNRNDPMCHSTYMEDFLPTMTGLVTTQPYGNTPIAPNTPYAPNMPPLAPQPTQDGYYSSDGVDDGRISTMEKIKAFAKGGTYNMVRGLFCDKNGFSLKRTLASALGATAIALTGPVGMAIASGVGLLCAVDNFNNSMHKAKFAMTDQQAREAYEGFGEATTTAGLSLWGGFKSFKALKAKFFSPKPTPSGGTPTPTGGTPAPTGATPAPTGATPAPTGGTPTPTGATPTPTGATPAPTGATPPPSGPTPAPTSATPTPTGKPAPINAEGFFNEWAPTGDIPPKAPTPQIQTHEYIPDWKPTGEMPKPTTHPYTNEWAPTGEIPKPTTHPYVNDWAPTGEIPKPTKIDTVVENNGHFFG